MELRKHWAIALVIALAVVVVYLPALIVPYGLTDDYLYLAQAQELELPSPPYSKSVMHTAAAEGRPLWGALVKPVFAVAGAIDNLRFVRIVTVFGIVALGLLLYGGLVRSRIGRLPATLIALLVCTMPPFQLYASWTVTFALPWAAFLAGCASLLAATAVAAPRRLRQDRLVAATLLLIFALFIYQPAAMMFWVFLAIALAGSVADSGRAVQIARVHLGVAAVAAVVGYVGYRICVWLVGPDAPGADRGTFTRDVAGKAEWFAHWALYGALNLFDVTWSAWLAVLVTAVAAGGLGLWLVRHAARPVVFMALAAVLVPLTVLPSLVVEETYDFVAYRALMVALVADRPLLRPRRTRALADVPRVAGGTCQPPGAARERACRHSSGHRVRRGWRRRRVEEHGHAHRGATAARAATAARPGGCAARARPECRLRAFRLPTSACRARRCPTSSDIRRPARGTRPSRSCCCCSVSRGGWRAPHPFVSVLPCTTTDASRRRRRCVNLNGLLGAA